MSGAGPGRVDPPVPAGPGDDPSLAVEPSHPPPAGSAEAGLNDPLAESFPASREGRLLFFIAVAFSAFQLLTALGLLALPSQIIRAVHVGFLLLLAFPLIAAARRDRGLIRSLSWVAALARRRRRALPVDLLSRSHRPLRAIRPISTLSSGPCSSSCSSSRPGGRSGRRCPILSGAFLAYCLLGQHLPPPLGHRGYDFSQVIDHMAFGTEGVYGIPVYVSSTYIFLFILFGAFLERAGMIRLFTDVALGLVGHARGGPAKVAVVSSALMGTISGSGVANVVTTGQFTIPLMKRFGYRAAFAGGVEATASMGGQIMPPVMGAVAFIMAETLDVAYAEIVKAAIVPALLYFGSAFWMVHLEAGRRGLLGLPKDQCPSALAALRERWYLVLPLAALVYPALLRLHAALRRLGRPGAHRHAHPRHGDRARAAGAPSFRVIFWIGLGLVAAAFLNFGVYVLAGALAALVAWNLFTVGRARDAPALARQPRRGRQDGAAGRHRLRHRRYHRRHDDADRARHHLRSVHRRGRRQPACSSRWC